MDVKNILIVDDEKPFLLSLKDGLGIHAAEYNVLLALNGKQAIEILKSVKIDLLVTDLKLPVLDGFGLLAFVSRQFPKLPVIVMTAFGTPEIEARLSRMDSLTYLEKPLDFEVLTKNIQSALELGSRSYIKGITLSTFIQLIYMERKTCTLKVQHQSEVGYLYIRNGHIIEAEAGHLRGLSAAYEIIAWDETGIEMDNHCRIHTGSISNPVEQVLLEALKIKDERSNADIRLQSSFDTIDESMEDFAASPFFPEEETFEAPKANIPQLKTVNDSRKERIDSFCRHSPGILEYMLLDEHNFPEFKSKDPNVLDDVDPSQFVDLASTISEDVGGGTLDHILFNTKSLVRYLIFKMPECRVVLSLKPGVRPNQIMKDIRKATGT